MNIKQKISKHITKIISNKKINIITDLSINRTPHKKWDYQINGLIKIAKILKITPYDFSKSIISKININKFNMYNKIDISNTGFINIFLNNQWLEKKLSKIAISSRLGIKFVKSKTIVIDYSSPNIAKQMHIGHLRSTIIGDATARIMEFLGHKVIRANHIGDWGTNLGIIIAYLISKNKTYKDIKTIDLDLIYQIAKKKYNVDHQFRKNVQKYVIKLQNFDQYCIKIWKEIVNITISKNKKIYQKLNVSLTNKNILGESFYNNMLSDIVSDLKRKNIATEIDGSTIILIKNIKNRIGNTMGVVIKKKDGTFLYSTTDLACLKYRQEILHADKILYYIDSRQHQYLTQIINIARQSGYVSNKTIIEHHNFGMICSENKRPFQTRSGNNIKLSDLLNEAVKRARIITQKKNKTLSEKNIDYLSEKIGIGSIKYFDLSKNRLTNYVFNWDHILNFDGNTAPYIQYGYVRILSIFKKSNISMLKLRGKIQINNVYERKLAIKLLQFEEVVLETADKGTPHIICQYLYELTTTFSQFYEKCPINTLIINSNIQKSRLLLAFITARIIKKGLCIIGVQTVKYM